MYAIKCCNMSALTPEANLGAVELQLPLRHLTGSWASASWRQHGWPCVVDVAGFWPCHLLSWSPDSCNYISFVLDMPCTWTCCFSSESMLVCPSFHSWWTSIFSMADSNNNVLMSAPDSAHGSDAQPGPSMLKHKCSIGTSNAQASPSSSNLKHLRNTPAQQPKKLKKPSDWHLRWGEVPKEAKKTKVCHMHVL